MATLTDAQLTTLQSLTARKASMLNRSGPAPFTADLGDVLAALAAGVQAIDTALATATTNFAAPVADITALAAVAAADRVDKQLRVVENDGAGHRSIYIFDSASTADADGVDIVAPGAGTGRWFRAYDVDAGTVGAINATGGPLAKGLVVAFGGWDATKSRFQIVAADPANATKQAVGVLGAQLADGASVALQRSFLLATSGLNTSGATVGDPVYLGVAGALTLTPPTGSSFAQRVGTVHSVAADGDVWIEVQPANPADAKAAAAQADATQAIADAAAAQADLDATVAQVAFTVAAEVADVVHVTIQAKKPDGSNLAAEVDLAVSLHDTEFTGSPSATAAAADGGAGTVLAGTGTAIVFGRTDAAGVLELDVTDATGGAFTRYCRASNSFTANARLIVGKQALLTWDA